MVKPPIKPTGVCGLSYPQPIRFYVIHAIVIENLYAYHSLPPILFLLHSHTIVRIWMIGKKQAHILRCMHRTFRRITFGGFNVDPFHKIYVITTRAIIVGH